MEKARLILFTTQSAEPYQDFVFHENDVLLMGRESAGAPPEVHEAADHRLFIPDLGISAFDQRRHGRRHGLGRGPATNRRLSPARLTAYRPAHGRTCPLPELLSARQGQRRRLVPHAS
ncbi:MAG: hypothetical protein WDN06_18955 [Asticcacaulis sp.]